MKRYKYLQNIIHIIANLTSNRIGCLMSTHMLTMHVIVRFHTKRTRPKVARVCSPYPTVVTTIHTRNAQHVTRKLDTSSGKVEHQPNKTQQKVVTNGQASRHKKSCAHFRSTNKRLSRENCPRLSILLPQHGSPHTYLPLSEPPLLSYPAVRTTPCARADECPPQYSAPPNSSSSSPQSHPTRPD